MDPSLTEKHDILVAAGFRPTSEYRGLQTNYTVPDDSKTVHLVWAWIIYQQIKRGQ